jgi:hypothetical protein
MHGSTPSLGNVTPERIGENQNHGNHEAVNGEVFNHGQSDESVRVKEFLSSGCWAIAAIAWADCLPHAQARTDRTDPHCQTCTDNRGHRDETYTVHKYSSFNFI